MITRLFLYLMQVIRNLHVVFTMNPSSEGLKDRAATSPALFNRYTPLRVKMFYSLKDA